MVVSAVATPFAVMIAYPAETWSRATLFALAVGMIFPIEDASSLTVVLPRFCVWIRVSLTFVTSLASISYAFKIVVRISSELPASVNPAFASLVELVTKFTASPVFCPAEIASYTFPAISDDEIPV